MDTGDSTGTLYDDPMLEVSKRMHRNGTVLACNEISHAVCGIALCLTEQFERVQVGYAVDPGGHSADRYRLGERPTRTTCGRSLDWRKGKGDDHQV